MQRIWRIELITMNLASFFLRSIILVCILSGPVSAAELIKNEKGVLGYDDTPYLGWIHYRVHDNARPRPPHVEAFPSTTPAPADAAVLFDGKSMEAWRANDSWTIKNKTLITGDGGLTSKEAFGSCQIHLEFKVPTEAPDKFTNRGNNGVGIMGLYEIQIFDSHPMHEDKLYADGQCAAIYAQTPPLVNACRKPGEWQSFDITFTAPVFDGKKVVTPAYVTVYHNGVLVHNQEEVRGPTVHRGIAPYKPHATKLPLTLKGHGSPVEFHNIWVRHLE